MLQDNKEASLETLQEIRNFMDRSARFVSLSGMSGIWAGLCALAGSYLAYGMLNHPDGRYVGTQGQGTNAYFDSFTVHLMLLGLGVFLVAFAGAFFFTRRKARSLGHTLWSNASRQMLLSGFFPMLVGGIFSVTFIYYGCPMFVAPACLTFYGLAVISGSRHTLSDIRYLGMLEVALGCTCLFFPGYGLLFWAVGFGILHIVYGAIMWNKYDK